MKDSDAADIGIGQTVLVDGSPATLLEVSAKVQRPDGKPFWASLSRLTKAPAQQSPRSHAKSVVDEPSDSIARLYDVLDATVAQCRKQPLATVSYLSDDDRLAELSGLIDDELRELRALGIHFENQLSHLRQRLYQQTAS